MPSWNLSRLPILLALLAAGCAPKNSPAPTAVVVPTAPAEAPFPKAAPDRSITPPKTPEAIAVSAGAPVLLKAAAKGVQIYLCKAKEGAPSVFEWTLKAPEADLFDDRAQKIGKHYAGPTWELADGSKVTGKPRTKVDAPEASAIPWVLLDAKTTEGTGLLSHVKTIQRVETTGGKAPPDGCDAAHSGRETRTDYTAIYYMYGPS